MNMNLFDLSKASEASNCFYFGQLSRYMRASGPAGQRAIGSSMIQFDDKAHTILLRQSCESARCESVERIQQTIEGASPYKAGPRFAHPRSLVVECIGDPRFSSADSKRKIFAEGIRDRLTFAGCVCVCVSFAKVEVH